MTVVVDWTIGACTSIIVKRINVQYMEQKTNCSKYSSTKDCACNDLRLKNITREAIVVYRDK